MFSFSFIYHLWCCYHYFVSSLQIPKMIKDIMCRTESRLIIQKVNTNFSISFTKIRGLWSNYLEVEVHLHEVKPNLLFLTKTGLNQSTPIQDYTTLSYSPLLTKDDHLNKHSHGFGAYIKHGFPCDRDPPPNEDPD